MVRRPFFKSLLRVFLLVLLIFGLLQLHTTNTQPYQYALRATQAYEYAVPHMSGLDVLLSEVVTPARAYFDACDCTNLNRFRRIANSFQTEASLASVTSVGLQATTAKNVSTTLISLATCATGTNARKTLGVNLVIPAPGA